MSHAKNMEKFQEMLDGGPHRSQCVFGFWAERLGIDEEFAMRISSGLGMGVNHGDSCGAVTSTALAFGLVHGFSQGSDSGEEGGIKDLEHYASDAYPSGGEWEGVPSPTVVAVGSGVGGLALGILAAAVVTYERRRAQNERA